MSVPLFNLVPQNQAVRADVDAAIARVLDSGGFILGKEVDGFEKACADFLGARHAVGVGSGSDALVVALAALGVGPGDEVVVPAFTYGATAMAVRWTGARPVFADIDPASFNLSAASLEAAITPRTKAAIPVHLYGRPADMVAIAEACCEAGIDIVEDAAQSMGASFQGAQTGTTGKLGCFSFYPTKPLGGFGDGGLVCTDDDGLADALKIIRAQGDRGGYTFERQGGNFRLDALQAAALSAKLPHVEAWRKQRDEAAGFYAEAFAQAGLGDAVTLPEPAAPGMNHAWALYVIRAKDRAALTMHLKERGIGAGVYYPSSLHLQKAFLDLGGEPGQFPETERACAEVLALPMFAGLTRDQVGEVVDAVAGFYNAGGK